MTYINFKGAYGVETVDQFDTRKEAREALTEYNMALGGGCYISQRCTNDWRSQS